MKIKNILERRKKIKFIEKLTGRKLLKHEKEFMEVIWKKKAKGEKIVIMP